VSVSPTGPKQFCSTSFGDIAYLAAGDPSRPPVLFIHGIPTSSYLWRDVLRMLQHDFRCYAPDLMGLGDTDVDPDATPMDMEAQAEMLEEFMLGMGHETFGVVCHDQGGAAAQILAARRPGRIRCLVITNCVAYGNWPVPEVARLQQLFRIPVLPRLLIRSGAFLARELRTPLSAFRRGVYRPEAMSDEAIREYLRPLHGKPAERRRFVRFLMAGTARTTLGAVEGLRRFDRPTAVLWAAEDRYISPSWGKKLFEEIPGACQFELIGFCGHFWQEERPAEFAGHIGRFLAAHATSRNEQTAVPPKRRPKARKKAS